MSIDNLFRQLKDIQFQADKILKAKKIDDEKLARFAVYSISLKQDLIDLQLNEAVSIHVNDIENINVNFNPNLPAITSILGALSFGVVANKYRASRREKYFRENVKNIRDQFICIDHLLKEI